MKKKTRNKKTLSNYEKEALRQIHIWKSPKLSWWSKSLEYISKPIDELIDKAFDTEVGKILMKVISGLFKITGDTAHRTINTNNILREYHKRGYQDILDFKDIHNLDLEEVDKLIGWLDHKYQGIAITEGAATGATGIYGLAADIPALVAINMRAIGEYATYLGFNINLQQERLFAMNVLAYASSPTDASKQLALAQLIKIAQDVAKKRAWKNLEQHAFVNILQAITKTIGIRLTKAKLAQWIPISGAIVGGGFNVYYTNKVCTAAFYLYRERFLATKYGPDVIEVTVKPSKDLDPNYPEESEQLPKAHK